MAFEYLADYVTFESVEEMDMNVEQHIQEHYYDLTDNERAIVFKLASHALDYPGTLSSSMKQQTYLITIKQWILLQI